MTQGDGAGATAAMPAQMAMGFGIAQEMVKSMHPTEGVPAGVPAAAPTGIAELLSPAEAAQTLGVTEADVIASLEAGDLKGKKIGATWRITRTALTAFLAE